MADDDVMAAALAEQAHADALEAAARETADAPVPQLSRRETQALVGKYAGREIDFVNRYGISFWRTLSYRQVATIRGCTAKEVWLAVQFARLPKGMWEELHAVYFSELAPNQRTVNNLMTRMIDDWRMQQGQKPIRDRSTPTHNCPNCGHRW